MRITKRFCEDLRKRDGVTKRLAFWDEDLPGFGVRLSPGGKVSFLLKYRVRGDLAQRHFTLGQFPALAPDPARQEAAAIKTAAGAGRDLVAERRDDLQRAAEARQASARRSLPISQLLDEWRLRTEGDMAQKAREGASVLYERELLRLEAKIVRPELGRRTVGDLDPEAFQALIEVQSSLSTARNLRNLLVRFTRFARARLTLQGMTVAWPVAFEVKGRPRSRTARYSLAETARLWVAAGRLGRRGALVRLMLLTGCRRIEAQQLERQHLVLEDKVVGPHWLQPSPRTKNRLEHRVPLSPPAVAMLRWLPPRLVRRGQEAALVFAGRGGKPIGGWTLLRRRLLEEAGVDAGTLHDFRRTLVSTLGDHGFDPQVADSLLNHVAATSMSGVMAVYQRSEFWERRVEAIALWTRLLMAEVERVQGKPLDPISWGFDQPFEDVRIPRVAEAPKDRRRRVSSGAVRRASGSRA